MKISLNCKLDSHGAFGFIKPIADLKDIEQIVVFRDTKALPAPKTKYITPKIRRPAILCQIYKFFQMLRYVRRDISIAIGIYEIPHGLFAFVIGKLKKIPVVICFISNPANRKIVKGLRKAVTYFILKRADVVTVTGKHAKSILVENEVSEKKIYILPNSFDVSKFLPRAIGKKYDVLSLSYLGPGKNLANFVKIIGLIKKRMPDIKAAIAGKGPEKENLEQLITRMSLEDNIDLLGYVDDAAKYYNQSNLFVLTSITEGLPRTVIEAMACGIPCVVSKVGSIGDLVKDSQNGFVIDDYNDMQDFAQKIIKLLTDKNLYDMFSTRACEDAVKNYSQKAATAVWRQILDNITGNKDDG